MTEQPFSAPLETLRKRVQEATQNLLGDTIGIGDADWNRPSGLPGWSRANVATHLAANAEAFCQLVEEAVDGRRVDLYSDPEARRAGIEEGSSLAGLDLQICLDTSAGRLERAMDEVSDWSAPIELLGRPLTMAQVPMARLSEVVIHHLDLDCGFDVEWLQQGPARWLLQWALLWHADDPDLPSVRLESSSGLVADLGRNDERRTISGTDAQLWSWLMGRVTPGDIPQGADGLSLSPRS